MSNKNQPRQRKGARIAGRSAGGEWASKVRSTADAGALGYSDLSTADAQREAIYARLEQTGSVPASTVESATNPRFTDGIDIWWEQHYERMEQPAGGGTFQVMPDDYTPAMTGGKSLDGNRRTHRIRYSGAGVELRMPSATAIKRFSAENGKRTFDVPVEIEHEGGKVSGFVRVTEGTPGAWEVQALNFPGKAAGRVAESVACVLEARRPRMALKDAEAQYAARRELIARDETPDSGTLHGASPLHQKMIDRMARRGSALQTTRVKSSLVRGVGYDQATGTMTISLNGRVYGYRTNRDTFLEVLNGAAPGSAYNDLVKGRAERVPVERCGKCRRYSRASVSHVCPTEQSRGVKQDAFRSKVATMILGSLRKRKQA